MHIISKFFNFFNSLQFLPPLLYITPVFHHSPLFMFLPFLLPPTPFPPFHSKYITHPLFHLSNHP
jgi:hypothetical protein